MTINERLELIRAGYTKAEIEAFEKPEEPKKEPEKPKEEPKKEPEKPKEEPKKEPEKQKEDNAVLAAINNLTKAIQLQNMQKIGLETPGGMTAEEALAAGVFGNPIKQGGK